MKIPSDYIQGILAMEAIWYIVVVGRRSKK